MTRTQRKGFSADGLTAAAAAALADDLQRRWVDRDDYSFDPYDGLMARRVPAALLSRRVPRLALVQLHKRLPFNARPLFGIDPTKNSYAVAHFASAVVRLHGVDAARPRLDWLVANRVSGGWAYPFDVQTKTFHYSRRTPNVVCTVFAGNAFLDAVELAGDRDWLPVAVEAARFVATELSAQLRGRPYFTYLPDRPEMIHNGNVLAAQLLVRAGHHAGDAELVERGLAALPLTLDAIAADGSLLYGEGPSLSWVDGHHTGFVVEALWEIERTLPGRVAGLADTVQRMARYYQDHLIGTDGHPYQRPHQPYPLDTIAGAQAVQTFAKLGGDYLAPARSTAAFIIDHMQLPSGHFAYLASAHHRKRVPYARWSDAPMSLALATLADALEPGRGRLTGV